MADIAVTAKAVRPLNNAVIRRWPAGAAGSVGQVVYRDADGAKPARANAVGTSRGRGIVVGVNGQPGQATFAAGDALDVVTHGPVEFAAGLTVGAEVFVSPATAGATDQTAPTTATQVVFAVGYAESATILYVAPQAAAPVAL